MWLQALPKKSLPSQADQKVENRPFFPSVEITLPRRPFPERETGVLRRAL
jgi:hypothetical protein